MWLWRLPFFLMCCAAEESCPAEGCGAKQLRCIKWRQTAGCDPKGPREKGGDKDSWTCFQQFS